MGLGGELPKTNPTDWRMPSTQEQSSNAYAFLAELGQLQGCVIIEADEPDYLAINRACAGR